MTKIKIVKKGTGTHKFVPKKKPKDYGKTSRYPT